MNSRRRFLGMTVAALAGAQMDPERLLWVPGAKVYSIPAPEACSIFEKLGSTPVEFKWWFREDIVSPVGSCFARFKPLESNNLEDAAEHSPSVKTAKTAPGQSGAYVYIQAANFLRRPGDDWL